MRTEDSELSFHELTLEEKRLRKLAVQEATARQRRIEYLVDETNKIDLELCRMFISWSIAGIGSVGFFLLKQLYEGIVIWGYFATNWLGIAIVLWVFSVILGCVHHIVYSKKAIRLARSLDRVNIAFFNDVKVRKVQAAIEQGKKDEEGYGRESFKILHPWFLRGQVASFCFAIAVVAIVLWCS